MKQFFEAYHQAEKLSPLVREISWTNNLLILSGTKSEEDKALLRSKPHEFYEISLLGKSI